MSSCVLFGGYGCGFKAFRLKLPERIIDAELAASQDLSHSQLIFVRSIGFRFGDRDIPFQTVSEGVKRIISRAEDTYVPDSLLVRGQLAVADGR